MTYHTKSLQHVGSAGSSADCRGIGVNWRRAGRTPIDDRGTLNSGQLEKHSPRTHALTRYNQITQNFVCHNV